MEPGELTYRFWNILDGGHPDCKLMKKLLKRKKRNFVFANCILFSVLCEGSCDLLYFVWLWSDIVLLDIWYGVVRFNEF